MEPGYKTALGSQLIRGLKSHIVSPSFARNLTSWLCIFQDVGHFFILFILTITKNVLRFYLYRQNYNAKRGQVYGTLYIQVIQVHTDVTVQR